MSEPDPWSYRANDAYERGFFVRLGLDAPLRHCLGDDPQQAVAAYLSLGVSLRDGALAWVWRAAPVRPDLPRSSSVESLGPVGDPRVFEVGIEPSELKALVIHAVRNGNAACGLGAHVEGVWPDGHTFALEHCERESVTCAECRRVVAEGLVHIMVDGGSVCGYEVARLPARDAGCSADEADRLATCHDCLAGWAARRTSGERTLVPAGDGRVVCPNCEKVRPQYNSDLPARRWQAMLDAYLPCCNPECGGHWGTGCWHCHHPKFWDEQRARLAQREQIEVLKSHGVTGAVSTVVLRASGWVDARVPERAWYAGSEDGRVFCFYADAPHKVYASLDDARDDHPGTQWEVASLTTPLSKLPRDQPLSISHRSFGPGETPEINAVVYSEASPAEVVEALRESGVEVADSELPNADGVKLEVGDFRLWLAKDHDPTAKHGIYEVTDLVEVDDPLRPPPEVVERVVADLRAAHATRASLFSVRPLVPDETDPDEIPRQAFVLDDDRVVCFYADARVAEYPTLSAAQEDHPETLWESTGVVLEVTEPEQLATLYRQDAPQRRARLDRETQRLLSTDVDELRDLVTSCVRAIYGAVDDLDAVPEATRPASVLHEHLQRGNIRKEGEW